MPSAPAPDRRRTPLGLAVALLSAATFGTSGPFASALLDTGWTAAAAVTVRVGLAAVVLTVPALVLLRAPAARAALRHGVRPVLAYGVVAVAGAQVCYFNAVQHLDVAVALLLEYLGTVLVVGWLWLRHGQRPTPLTLAGSAASVVGLALVLDVLGATSVDVVGVLWGLGAAVGLAVYFTASAHTDAAMPPLVMAWGGLGTGAALLAGAGAAGVLPFAVATRDVVLVGHEIAWYWPVLGLTLVAAVVAYVTGITGARLLGARLASFVGLAEVLFAVVFAWLLLGQTLSPLQLAGAACVVLGIALVRAGEPDVEPVAAQEVPDAAAAAVSPPAQPVRRP